MFLMVLALTACPTGTPWMGVAETRCFHTPSGQESWGSNTGVLSAKSTCTLWPQTADTLEAGFLQISHALIPFPLDGQGWKIQV